MRGEGVGEVLGLGSGLGLGLEEAEADPLVDCGGEALARRERGVEVAAGYLPHVRVHGHRARLVEAEERHAVGHLGSHAR